MDMGGAVFWAMVTIGGGLFVSGMIVGAVLTWWLF